MAEWEKYASGDAVDEAAEPPKQNPLADDVNPFIYQPERDPRLDGKAAMIDTMARVDRMEAADTAKLRTWQSRYGRGGLNIDERSVVSPDMMVTPTVSPKAGWGKGAWEGPGYTYNTETGVLGDAESQREMMSRAALSQSASTSALNAGRGDFGKATPYFSLDEGYDNPLGDKAQRDLYGVLGSWGLHPKDREKALAERRTDLEGSVSEWQTYRDKALESANALAAEGPRGDPDDERDRIEHNQFYWSEVARAERNIKKTNEELAAVRNAEAGGKGLDKTTMRAAVDSALNGGIQAFAAAPLRWAGIAAGYVNHGPHREGKPDLDNALTRAGDQIMKLSAESFPNDPVRQFDFTNKLAQGAGSMVAMFGHAGLGAMMRAGEAGQRALIAVSGAMQQGVQGYDEATQAFAKVLAEQRREDGLTHEEEKKAWSFFWNSIAGTSEAVPFVKNWAKTAKTRHGYILGHAGEQALEEFLQEGGQQVSQNVIAGSLYDPTRPWHEDVAENAAVGGILGGAFGGMGSAKSALEIPAVADRLRAEREQAETDGNTARVAEIDKALGAIEAEYGFLKDRPVRVAKAKTGKPGTMTDVEPAPVGPSPSVPSQVQPVPSPEPAPKHGLPPEIADHIARTNPDMARKYGIDVPLDAVPEAAPVERQTFTLDEASRETLPSAPASPAGEGSTATVDTAPGPIVRRVVTPDNSMEVEAQEQIVELATLKRATGEMQPRDRSRDESAVQTRTIAANLDPEQMRASRVSDTGAPIISGDSTIVSGNGRTMALEQVYRDPALAKQAAAYRASLGAAAAGMKEPVRVLRLPQTMPAAALVEFADKSNRARIAAMSATERATRDARAAGDDVMGLYEGGEVTAPQNQTFFRAFVGKAVDAAERGSISKDGRLTKEGADRISNAILAAAYGDPDLLSRMLESTDDNIRSVTGAMRDAAGSFIRLRQAIAAGEASAKFDITPQVVETARRIADLRDRGIKPAEFRAQQDAFTQVDPIVEDLLRAFYNDNLSRMMSRQKLTEVLTRYADESAKHREDGLFEDTTRPSEIIAVARERALEEGADLFGSAVEPGGTVAADGNPVGGGRADGGPDDGLGGGAAGQPAQDDSPVGRAVDGLLAALDGGLSLKRGGEGKLAEKLGVDPAMLPQVLERASERGLVAKDDKTGRFYRPTDPPRTFGAGDEMAARQAVDGVIADALETVRPMMAPGQVVVPYDLLSAMPQDVQKQAIGETGLDALFDPASMEVHVSRAAFEVLARMKSGLGLMRGRLAHEGGHALFEIGRRAARLNAIMQARREWRQVPSRSELEEIGERDNQVFPEADRKLLAERARKLTDAEKGKKAKSFWWPEEQYRTLYWPAVQRFLDSGGRTGTSPYRFSVMIEEEAAMHVIDAYVAGQRFGRKVDTIIGRILNLLRRIGNGLRGLGFRTADDVLRAFTAGEHANNAVMAQNVLRASVAPHEMTVPMEVFSTAPMASITDDRPVTSRSNYTSFSERPLDVARVTADGIRYLSERMPFGIEPLSGLEVPRFGFLSGVWKAAGLRNPPATLKGAQEVVRAAIQATGDIADRKAGREQGQSGVGAPLRASYARMLPMLQDLEIFDAVIKSVPVDVMNILVGHQGAPKSLFGNEAMLLDLLSTYGDVNVRRSLGDAPSPFEVIARLAAEKLGSPEQHRRLAMELLSTYGAGDRWHGAYDRPSGLSQQAFDPAHADSPNLLYAISRSDQMALDAIDGVHFGSQTMFAIRTDEKTGKRFIEAYHGSPHDFDRFDMSKIGTGEGAQAYGHGLYFAENEGIARSYRNDLSRAKDTSRTGYRLDGAVPDFKSDPRHIAWKWASDDGDNAAAIVRSRMEMYPHEFGPAEGVISPQYIEALRILDTKDKLPQREQLGKLYQVRINADPEHFLDWDKPLSQQSEAVKRALADGGYERDAGFARNTLNPTIGDSELGTTRLRNPYSAFGLRDAGIPGIKYLDQGSRAAGDGSRNYVVFDDGLIEITHKDGKPVSPEERAEVVSGMKPSGPMYAISRTAPAGQVQREAMHLMADVKAFEAAQWKAGATADEIAARMHDRYGIDVPPEDLVAGRVWWKIDEMLGEPGGDLVLPALVGGADREDNPLIDADRELAATDVDARPSVPQIAHGVAATSGARISAHLSADEKAEAVTLWRANVSVPRIAERLTDKRGSYVRLVDVSMALEESGVFGDPDRFASPVGMDSKKDGKRERNETIVAAAKRGDDFATIAAAHGISRQRVSEIVNKAGLRRRMSPAEAEAARIAEQNAPETVPLSGREAKFWTADRDNLLINALRRSPRPSAAAIAAELYAEMGVRVSAHAVHVRTSRLRADGLDIEAKQPQREKPPRGFPWTPEALAMLTDQELAHLSATELATMINARFGGPQLTGTAVRVRRSRMGGADVMAAISRSQEDMEDWAKALEEENERWLREHHEPAAPQRYRQPDAEGGQDAPRGQPAADATADVGTADDEQGRGHAGAAGRDGSAGRGGRRFDIGRDGRFGLTAEGRRSVNGERQKFFFVYKDGAAVPSDGATDETALRIMRQTNNWLANVHLVEREPGRWEVQSVKVRKTLRGQGLASALYDAIEKHLGITMQPSGTLPPDGYRFWKKRDPDAVRFHAKIGDGWLSPRQMIVWKTMANDLAEQATSIDEIERAMRFNAQLNDALRKLPPEVMEPGAFERMFAVSRPLGPQARANQIEQHLWGQGVAAEDIATRIEVETGVVTTAAEIIARNRFHSGRQMWEQKLQAAGLLTFAGENAKTADLNALARAKALAKDGASREQIWDETGWFRGVDGKWRWEIDDSGAKWAGPENGGASNIMRNYLPHDGLYAAYPSVADMLVETPTGSRKAFFDEWPAIHVGGALASKTSESLHETQHRLQSDETFALGGNPTMFVDTASDEIRGLMDRAYSGADPFSPEAQEARDAVWRTIDANRDALGIPTALYRMLAGEVEARNVQRRMNMTPEERRANPPWTTEDVPQDQQIVRFGNGAQMMAALEEAAERTGEMIPTDRDARTKAREDIAAGRAVWVDDKVVVAHLAAARPHLVVVPDDVRVAAVTSVIPMLNPTKESDVVVGLRGIDGWSYSIESRADVVFNARAIFDGQSGTIVLSRFGTTRDVEKSIGGEIRHEAGHALWRRPSFAAARDGLLAHANSIGLLDVDMGDYLRLIGTLPPDDTSMNGITIREVYEYVYRHWPERSRAELLDEEAVSYLIEMDANGTLPAGFADGVRDILDAFAAGAYTGRAEEAGEREAAQMAAVDASIGRSMRDDLDRLGYYSGALRAAKALRQSKGTPEQMLAMLGKEGAKKAEIEATGLDKALEGKTSVTKDEIIAHLEQNRVGLNEVRRGGSADDWKVGRPGNFHVDAARRGDLVAPPKWSSYSLDPSNPSYRETVLHLPEWYPSFDDYVALKAKEAGETVSSLSQDDIARLRQMYDFGNPGGAMDAAIADKNFYSGHFPEPNITGHLMTSMTRHEGKPVYTIDQIQSDWGQKLRDGGVRDEAKIAELKQKLANSGLSKMSLRAINEAGEYSYARRAIDNGSWPFTATKEVGALSKEQFDAIRLLQAELHTAEAAANGHPLVNTTDQWTTTTLRRALRQAAEADADYIAIPHGDTVLSYNPGDEHGMRSFYGDRSSEGIVPKNLRKILSRIDKDGTAPIKVKTLETPSGKRGYRPDKQGEFDPDQTGFTLFPLTDKVKAFVIGEGQPMFAVGRTPPPNLMAAVTDPMRGINAIIRDMVTDLGITAKQGISTKDAKAARSKVRKDARDAALKAGATAKAAKQAGEDAVRQWGGYYNPRTGVFRTPVFYDTMRSINVLADLGGDAIQKRMGSGLADIIQRSAPGLPAGFNAWFRLFVTNGTAAVQQAPRFVDKNGKPDDLYNAFFDLLTEREPVLLAKLMSTRDAIEVYYKANPTDVAESMVVDSGKASSWDQFQKDRERFGTRAALMVRLSSVYTATVDDLNPVYLGVRDLLRTYLRNSGKKLDLAAALNPWKIMRVQSRHANAYASRDMDEGIRAYADGTPRGPSLVKALAKALGDDRSEALKTGPGSRYRKFSTYLVARYAMVEWGRFRDGTKERPPTAMPPGASNADEAIAFFNSVARTYEQQHPEFMDAADMVYDFERELLTLQRDAGLISAAKFDELVQDREYVPFLRSFEEEGDDLGAGRVLSGGQRSIFKTKRGSNRDIIDAIASIGQKVFETRQMIAQNDAKRSLMQLAEAAGPGGGVLVERLDPVKLKAMGIDVVAALKQAAKENDVSEQDTADFVHLAQQLLGSDATATVFSRQTLTPGNNVLFFWEAGSLQAMQLGGDGQLGARLAQAMYDTINTFGQQHHKMLMGMALLTGPAQMVRMGVTTHPEFAIANIIRDAWMAFLYDPKALPLWTQVKGLADVARGADYVKGYMRFGSMMGGEATSFADKLRMQRDTRALVERGYKFRDKPTLANAVSHFAELFHARNWKDRASGAAIGAVAGGSMAGPVGLVTGGVIGGLAGGHLIAKVGEASETATRARLWKHAYDRAIKNGMGVAEAGAEAAYWAHDYGDYARHGSRTETWRSIIPFFNANIQGNDTYVRRLLGKGDYGYNPGLLYPLYKLGLKDVTKLSATERIDLGNSAWAWFMTVFGIGSVSMVLALLYRDDERIKNAPEQMKSTHWLIPIDGDNIRETVFLRVPKPFQTVWFAQAIERLVMEQGKDNPRWLENYLYDLWNTWKPPLMPTTPGLAFDLATGVSSDTGRAIVPKWKEARLRRDQYDEYTSEFAKWLARNLDGAPSPFYTDYMIRKLGASWANTALRLNTPGLPWYNPTKPDVGPDEMFIARRFLWGAGKGSEASRVLRELAGGDEPVQGVWNRISVPYSKLTASAADYKLHIDRVVPDVDGAVESLKQMTPRERGFAILGGMKGHEDAKLRMLDPINRAAKIGQEIVKLQKEIIDDQQHTGKVGKAIGVDKAKVMPLSPSEKLAARQILTQLNMMEAHNALVLTGEAGWDKRVMFDTSDLKAEFKTALPKLYKEYEGRMAKAGVLPWRGIQATWPAVRSAIEDDKALDGVRKQRFEGLRAKLIGRHAQAAAMRDRLPSPAAPLGYGEPPPEASVPGGSGPQSALERVE